MARARKSQRFGKLLSIRSAVFRRLRIKGNRWKQSRPDGQRDRHRQRIKEQRVKAYPQRRSAHSADRHRRKYGTSGLQESPDCRSRVPASGSGPDDGRIRRSHSSPGPSARERGPLGYGRTRFAERRDYGILPPGRQITIHQQQRCQHNAKDRNEGEDEQWAACFSPLTRFHTETAGKISRRNIGRDLHGAFERRGRQTEARPLPVAREISVSRRTPGGAR